MKIDSGSSNIAQGGGGAFERVNQQEARLAARQERQEARQAARQERIEARAAARQERIEAREASRNERAEARTPTQPISQPLSVDPDGSVGPIPFPLEPANQPVPIDPGFGGFNIPFGGPVPIDPGFGGGDIFPPDFAPFPSAPVDTPVIVGGIGFPQFNEPFSGNKSD